MKPLTFAILSDYLKPATPGTVKVVGQRLFPYFERVFGERHVTGHAWRNCAAWSTWTNVGMPRPQPKPGHENDPPYSRTDPLLEPLDLHKSELEAITEFLRTL